MARCIYGLMGGAAVGMLAFTAGCGWLLGLDEFVDQPPPGAGGGGSGGRACTAAADCPAGEHGSATCEEGLCGFQCEAGFDDCDEAVGCETATAGDKSNCGGCGITCGAYCVGSSCNDPVAVAAGYSHTCALLKDGSIFCWGSNKNGELGDGTTEDKHTPTRVMLPPAVEISAGGTKPQPDIPTIAHTCAVLVNQELMCWGSNSSGQLGTGSTLGTPTPVSVPIIDAVHIATGGQHTCAVRSGSLLSCWGENSHGQVGNGTTQMVLSPAQVSSTTTQVAVGKAHTCIIRNSGAAACWGWNAFGQLGIGPMGDKAFPVAITGLDELVQITAGVSHTCARRSVGAYCWGSSTSGQLGLGDLVDHDVPQALTLPNIDFIALGGAHSSAIVDGSAYLWGANSDGQIGDGTSVSVSAPKAVDLANVAMMSLGFQHSCALTNTGTILCWGSNNAGQLGDGTTSSKGEPTAVVWGR